MGGVVEGVLGLGCSGSGKGDLLCSFFANWMHTSGIYSIESGVHYREFCILLPSI